MKKIQYLGFYDSGVGGLTVLKEVRKIYPKLSFHYLADSSSLPLGNKSIEQIRKRVKRGVDLLFSKDCSLVILACNTASITSARYVQQKWLSKLKQRNILGISWPLIELMEEEFENLKKEKGLVLSTEAVHKNGFYRHELSRRGFKNIKSLAVPGLAVGIERKDKKMIKKSLETLRRSLGKKVLTIDYVILACTHYPLALLHIREYFNPGTIFINPARVVAEKLRTYLEKHPKFEVDKKDRKRFFWKT